MAHPTPHAGTIEKKLTPQSSLRNEVHVGSDSDGAYDGNTVECPRSDEVIPETQMDNLTTAANLPRSKQPKQQPKQQLKPTMPFCAVGPWERDPVQSLSESFAFSVPGPGSKKRGSPKENMETSKESLSVDFGRPHVDAAKELQLNTSNVAGSPSSAVQQAQAYGIDSLEATGMHTLNTMDTESRLGNPDIRHAENNLFATTLGFPSLSNCADSSVNVSKKSRVKSGKKSKQKNSMKRHPEPIIPQSMHSVSEFRRTAQVGPPTSSAMTTHRTPSPQTEDREVLCLGSKPSSYQRTELYPGSTQGSSWFGPRGSTVAPPKVNSTSAAEKESCNMPNIEDMTVCSVTKEQSPDRINTVGVHESTRRSCQINTQQDSRMLSNLPSSSNMNASHATPMESLQQPQESTISHPRPQRPFENKSALEATVDDTHLGTESAHQELSAHLQVTAAQSARLDQAIHGVSNRGAPSRITKQQKKPRGPQKTQVTAPTAKVSSRIAPAISNVDHAMETLRIAIVSNQIRANHDHDLKEKASKKVAESLHETVRAQNALIARLEAEQQVSRTGVEQLKEKARHNQKFVAGIQTDYEKLRKSFSTFHAESKKVLHDKLMEAEDEKRILCRELESTADSVRQSQRKMRSAVDEMHLRLTTSELQRKALSKNLELQTAKYDEKKKRCEELEKQVLSSVQGVQRQLGESFTAITERLEQRQKQSDQADSNGNRDAVTMQCLEEVKKLQTMPFLAPKDVENFERLLQRVLERVNSPPKGVSETANSKDRTVEEFESRIHDQLERLKSEIQKHENIVVENSQARQSIGLLERQLETEKQRVGQLEADAKALRHTELDLRSQLRHSERELDASKATVCRHDTDPLELERKVLALQQQLEQADQRVEAANEKLEQSERLREGIERDLGMHKDDLHSCRHKLVEIANQKQDDEKTKKDATVKLRTAIETEFKGKMAEQERTYLDQIHSIQLSCNEKEKLIQDLTKEVDAQKNTRQTERQALNQKDDELKSLRESIKKADAQIQAAQQKSADDATKLSDVADLKAQLQRKSDILGAKEKEYEILEHEKKQDTQKLSELQGLRKSWQAETSANHREMEILRAEAHDATTAETKRLQNALEETQSLILALEHDNQSKCDENRDLEKRINDAEAAFSIERDESNRQIKELRKAKDESDAAVTHLRVQVDEDVQRAAHASRSQVDDVRLQLKQAEAKNREMVVAHERQLQYVREETEAKYELLVREADRKLKEVQRATKPLITPSTPSQISRPRRDPTAEAGESTSEGRPTFIDLVPESPLGGDGGQSFFNYLEEVYRDEGESQRIFDPDAEIVIETQEPDLPRPLSSQSFEEDDSRPDNSTHHRHSSTELSSADSELMTQLEQNSQVDSLKVSRGRSHNDEETPSRKRGAKTSARSNDLFSPSSQSSLSRDRPRSQANTASRMMPPQGTISQHFSPHSRTLDKTTKPKALDPKQIVKKATSNQAPDRVSGFASQREQDGNDGDRVEPSELEALLGSFGSHRRKRGNTHEGGKQFLASKKPRVLHRNSSATRNSYSSSPSGELTGSLLTAKQYGATSTRTPAQLGSLGSGPYEGSQHQASQGVESRRKPQSPSVRSQTAATPRRTSARITKSKTTYNKSRKSDYEERFSQELGGH